MARQKKFPPSSFGAVVGSGIRQCPICLFHSLYRRFDSQQPSNSSHPNDLLCLGRDGRYLPLARVRDALCAAEACQPGPHVQHHREPACVRHSRPPPGI
jgi:hypothetical protein